MVDLSGYGVAADSMNHEDINYIAHMEEAKAAYTYLIKSVRNFGTPWDELDDAEKHKWFRATGEISMKAFWDTLREATDLRKASKAADSQSGKTFVLGVEGMPEEVKICPGGC